MKKIRSNVLWLASVLAVSLSPFSTNAQPDITGQLTNQTVWFGGTASFSVAATGAGPFTYQWQFNSNNLPVSMITTAAGNGIAGYSGDGGYATDTELYSPTRVALDSAGDLIIGEAYGRIRKVTPVGIITTIAGGGSNYPGDGGYATNAELAVPSGLALDTTGDLFISDFDKNVIRKVDTNGIITTVAGTGVDDCTGDGNYATNATLDSPQGIACSVSSNLFVATCHAIRNVDSNGIITSATPPDFYIPVDVLVDPRGNFYVADGGSAMVLYVDFSTRAVTPVAGGGDGGDGGPATNAALSFIGGIARDARGDLFIADWGNNRVRRVDTNGIITTAAGTGTPSYSGDGGSSTNAELSSPTTVALDASGNLFIADTGNQRIREVSFHGLPTLTTSNAGDYDVIITDSSGASVTSTVAVLTVVPRPSVTIQPTNQLVWTGSGATLTSAITYSGPVSYQWQFNGSNIPGATASVLTLTNVTTANAGTYQLIATGPANSGSVASDTATLAVAIPPESQIIWSGSSANLSTAVAGPGPFTYRWQLNGTNLPPSLITTIAGNGTADYFGDGGPAKNASLNFPSGGWSCGLAFDARTNLLIPDIGNNRIRRINTNGGIETIAGNGNAGYSGDGGPATNAELNFPEAIAVDAAGNLFVCDASNQRIRKIDMEGIIRTVAGTGSQGFSGDGGPATNAALDFPTGIAVNRAGEIFFADEGDGGRIRMIDTNGVISSMAGGGDNWGDGIYSTNAALFYPAAVLLDARGNLLIADGDNRIRKIDTNGIITTIAGGGAPGGDGGPATNAGLFYPLGLAEDPQGDVFIADSSDQEIREVEADGIMATATGSGAIGFSGDGGPGTLASLNAPSGLAFDSSGNLYFADVGNQRIRKVTPNGLPTLPVGASAQVSVVITGPSGSITSTPVTVTATASPLIFATARHPDGTVTLNLITAPNSSSRILAAANLVPDAQWQPLTTNLPGPSGVWSFTDTNAAALPTRFYRSATP